MNLPFNPTISIITIVFNGEQFIEQTILSVIEQTYRNIEYIIVDGGSTDRTLDIIKKYERHIARWTSKPDEGISDAMNKGLDLATGQYIFYLHADDYLCSPETIEKFVLEICDRKSDISTFAVLYGHPPDNLKKMQPRGYGCWLNFKTGFLHQGTFCKREVFNKIGAFDNQFKIAMDYDFFLRAYRENISCQKGNAVVSVMRDTGKSSRQDWPSLAARFAEERLVHKKNSPIWFVVYPPYWFAYTLYRLLRYHLTRA